MSVNAALDELLIPHGPDLDPPLYGGEPHPQTRGASLLPDRAKLALTRAALSAGPPVPASAAACNCPTCSAAARCTSICPRSPATTTGWRRRSPSATGWAACYSAATMVRDRIGLGPHAPAPPRPWRRTHAGGNPGGLANALPRTLDQKADSGIPSLSLPPESS